jgi:hypothetical protein
VTARAVGHTFLVGCPRSGTTLLQSLLFAHQDVISFPETFFFVKVLPTTGRWRRKFHLPSPEAPAAVTQLDALGVAADPSPSRLDFLTVRGYAGHFVRRMDRSAHEAGASVWVEKTPRHARHVKGIERHLPDARFVHMIRSGEAVCASLRDVGDREPELWGTSTAQELVEIWRRYLHYSLAWVGRPNHVFVSYERLVADPEQVMSKLCRFLDLSDDGDALERMLGGYQTSAAGVIGRVVGSGGGARVAGEPWKAGTDGAIANRNDEKLMRVFDEQERAEVSRAVATEGASVATIPFL